MNDPKTHAEADLPPRLKALLGALSLATLFLAIALAPLWLAGAAMAFVVGVTALHRSVWRWRPRIWAAGVVVAMTGAGGLVGFLVTGSRSADESGHTASRSSTRPPRTVQTNAPATPLQLDPDATCASVQGTSYNRDDKPHMIYVGSPGQLDAGNNTLVGRVLPKGGFTQVIRVESGDRVRISAELHNGGRGSIAGVSVAAVMHHYGSNCWRLWVRARSAQAGGNAKLGPVIAVWRTQRSTGLVYVPHSAILIDDHGKVIAHLADGVGRGGAGLPYAIPPTTYYVNFEVRVR